MKCGSIIKAIRNENNLSMEDFGLMIGVTKSYISLLERDLRQPSISLLTEIEHLFSLVFVIQCRDGLIHERK